MTNGLIIIYFYFITFRLFEDEDIDNYQKEANEGEENEDITEIVDIAVVGTRRYL